MCCSADCLLGFDTELVGNLAPPFGSVLTRLSGLAKMRCTTTKVVSDYICFVGRDSSVGVAIRYGIDGPGIESGWGEIFRGCPDRPWGPHSLHIMGIGSPSRWLSGRGLYHPPHLAPRLKKE